MNLTASDNHLGYQSVRITNTIVPDGSSPSYGNICIDSITTPTGSLDLLQGPDPLAKYCAKGDLDCDYQTDCNMSSSPCISSTSPYSSLAPASGTNYASCLVWFKANSEKDDGTDLNLQNTSSTTSTIEVAVGGQNN